jgi:hypothetical protein
LKDDSLSDDPTIGRNNGTLINLDNVTGDDLVGLDLLECAIAENCGLQGKLLLEFFDNGTSLEFLEETDTGVEQEETTRDTESNPILETGGENSSSLERALLARG